MPQPTILAFSGSTRNGSFNRQLLKLAVRGAEEAGAAVNLIDLTDYSMPIFSQDLEKNEGMPPAAHAFKCLLVEHDAMLIASPEYNSSISPLLKNSLDWASRAESKDEKPLAAYRGKWGAIMAASPGGLGGIRGLVSLRMLLGNLGVNLLTDQVTIPQAHRAFDEEGSLAEERQQEAILRLGQQLAKTVRVMNRD